MRIFVTGATGYLGFSIATALRRASHQVLGLARSDLKARRLWAEEIEPVLGTMDDPASYREAAKSCPVVVHAAVDYQGDTFGLDYRTVEALQAGRPEKLIYTSGVWVYGSTGSVDTDETAAPNPAARVVRRLDSERLALASSVPAVVLRPGCVYGREGGMFADWFAPISHGQAPTIIGPGTNRWALVHLDDLATGFRLAVESPIRGEILNLTDRSRETVGAMVGAASRAGGFSGLARQVPVAEAAETLGSYAECLALDQAIDSGKAERQLGWRPQHRGFVAQAETYYQAWRARR
jgi:nucleoside-diphosphate-sugar epimerase